MPTISLDQTYLFRGKFYGPGTVEVPEDFPTLKVEPPQSTTAPRKARSGRKTKAAKDDQEGAA